MSEDDQSEHNNQGTDELVSAATFGYVEKVESLIAEGHDATGFVGCSALCYAAANGHAAVVTSLLAAGAPLDSFEDFHVEHGTPLMKEAEFGHVEIVELLLAAANIAAVDRFAKTALLHAATNGHVQAVAYLLQRGAPVEGCDGPINTTPLIEASRRGHVEIVELLLAAGASVEATDSTRRTALFPAASNDHVEVVRVLINAGAKLDVGEASSSPLFLAVNRHHVSVVRELLAAGANPDEGKYSYERQSDGSFLNKGCMLTPLMKVADGGRLDMIRMLLDAGANVNLACRYGWTPLMHGAKTRDIVVRTLLDAGAEPFARHDRDRDHQPTWMTGTALDYASKGAIQELIKREMDRRKAAAFSVMPARVPLHVRQDIIWLAYCWKPVQESSAIMPWY